MASESVSTNLIVHPRTGEVLDLNQIKTDAILEARDLVSDGERELREFRRDLDDELIRRADHEGRRSLTFSEFRVDVSPPTEKTWDLRKLQIVLSGLVGEDTISLEKATRCIKYEPKPVWAELKTLLSDPRVREEIEACFTEEPARRYVKVSRHD